MKPDERFKHWRTLAECYLESAATLYRDGKYAVMLHHCYFAVQSALEAAFIAQRMERAPATVSLVVMGERLTRTWTAQQRDVMVELTDCARSIGERHTSDCSKDRCLQTLTTTVGLVRMLLT